MLTIGLVYLFYTVIKYIHFVLTLSLWRFYYIGLPLGL